MSYGGTPADDRSDAFNPESHAYNPTTGNAGEDDDYDEEDND